MTTLYVDNIAPNLQSAISAPSLNVTSSMMPAGSVIQTVQAITDQQQTFTTTAYTDLTNLQPTITPRSTSSKILLSLTLCYGENQDAFPAFKILANGTIVAQGLANQQRTTFMNTTTENSARDTYRQTVVNYQILHEPNTTSPITYKVQCSPMRTTNRTIYMNRHEDMGDANRGSSVSTFILQEIAG